MNPLRTILTAALICVYLTGGIRLSAQTAEVTAKDAPVTFRSGVNLVPVTVVVRDGSGRASGDLSVDNFQLFDNGKPQMISKFTIEKLAPANVTPKSAPTAPKPAESAGGAMVDAQSDGIPDRFIAYLFDDLHMGFDELNFTRDAARRQIDSQANPLQRAAIFTTSGKEMQEFTGNLDQLHKALDSLDALYSTAEKSRQTLACPPITYYLADQIYNFGDPAALNIVTADTMACANMTAEQQYFAIQMANTAARDAVATGDRDTERTLDTIRNIVSRLSSLPGQRTLVLVSPGFLVTDDRRGDQTTMIERAIRANVVVGALDSKGLYVPMVDASQPHTNTATQDLKATYAKNEAFQDADVMAFLADATGGAFYQGTNNYDEGFAQVATAPDYVYVLGFSPQDLKLDGKYHNLKVVLKETKGLSLQARKGYYAPKQAADPAEQANREIEETFFSREEVRDLPAVLQTQYFKSAAGEATLSAVTRIDVNKLSYRKEGGRNFNNLTVVAGLFDNDGNYVTSVRKVIDLKLLDDTLAKRLASGIVVKNSFPVRPGRYVVRMVARDSEGQLMAAQSSLVEIP